VTSPTLEATPTPAGRPGGSRVLKWTLIAAVLPYVVFFAFASVVFFFAFHVFYLWAYAGAFASAVAFTATLLMSCRMFRKIRHRLQLAAQLSAIAFAVAGIVLIGMSFLVSGQRLLFAGYSLHARIWLDADKTRTWANELDLSQESALSSTRWPLMIKVMTIEGARVDVDGERNVTIYQGGPLTGHWGVYITARGRDWTGERWADNPKYDRIKKVADGVWIWSSMN